MNHQFFLFDPDSELLLPLLSIFFKTSCAKIEYSSRNTTVSIKNIHYSFIKNSLFGHGLEKAGFVIKLESDNVRRKAFKSARSSGVRYVPP